MKWFSALTAQVLSVSGQVVLADHDVEQSPDPDGVLAVEAEPEKDAEKDAFHKVQVRSPGVESYAVDRSQASVSVSSNFIVLVLFP
jgi:hypothetical protein